MLLLNSFSCLLKCHGVRAVRIKAAAIRPPRSGTPPVRQEGFEAIWPVSGRDLPRRI